MASQILRLHFIMEWVQMSFFMTVCVSAILGLLSGLGVGGGSLLIMWLTLIVQADYSSAKYINLLFFLPPALISTITHLIRKKFPIRKVLPAALAGSACAAFFTILSSSWNVEILRKLFGILLLLTAWRELRYKKQTAE